MSHQATFIHCSKSVWGLSRECVSSENTQIFTSGAPSLALSALAYCCASTRGTLQRKHPKSHDVFFKDLLRDFVKAGENALPAWRSHACRIYLLS